MEHDNEGAYYMGRITVDVPNQLYIPRLHQNLRVEGTLEKKVARETKKVALENKKVAPQTEVTPEKKLKTFAITLSILDVMAIMLEVLKFYLVMQKTDLGVMIKSISVVTLILDVFRGLCRSRGLELYYIYNLKQLPLSIRMISPLFYGLHLISVLTLGVVSAVGLASHHFGKTEEALVFFYIVAILEAIVFIAAMAIWICNCRLFEKVRDECGLDKSDTDTINRFFYNFYYKLTGNIFDACKMDLVTFAQELLDSILVEDQLMGASTLKALLIHSDLSSATLDKIITSEDSKLITRLINILIFKNSFKEEVRCLAGAILLKLDEREPKMKQFDNRMKEAVESANDLLGTSNIESVDRDSGTRAL